MKNMFFLLSITVITTCIVAQAPDWEWVINAGGLEEDIGQSIATDDYGNIYVLGKFQYSATFGQFTMNNNGTDLFVAKIDQQGGFIWVQQAISSNGSSEGTDIAIDSNGNVYITGNISSAETSFGTQTVAGSGIFVAKLDTNGNWVWVSQTDGNSNGIGIGISYSIQSKIYITGNFQGETTFGTYSLTAFGSSDIFVAKLDLDGNWLWASQAGDSSCDSGLSLDTDDSGNCYITGNYFGSPTFGNYTITNSGSSDLYVAKINSSGNWIWATSAGGTSSEIGYKLVINNNSIYLTGRFGLLATFGSFTLTSSGTDIYFIAAINQSGIWEWAFSTAIHGVSYSDIAINNNGEIYLAGGYDDNVTIGTYNLPLHGWTDFFLAKLDQDGNWIWAEGYGGIGHDRVYSIALDIDETPCITGYFSDSVNFGTQTINCFGDRDIYVSKLSNNYFVAGFTANIMTGFNPLSVNFTDLSVGNIVSWEWDFQNDGVVDSNEQNPSWVYNESGTYDVSLMINDGINTDSEIKLEYICVFDSLHAEFEADNTNGFVPFAVNFTDLSIPSQSPITTWQWDFQNDGIVDSYEQNPTWIYNEYGIYDVSLIVSDTINSDSEIKLEYICVFDSLHAEFEANSTNGIAPFEVNFTDLSIPSQSPITIWQWDFQNDGVIDSYLQNPSFIYSDSGSFTVSLKVSDGINTDIEIKENYINVIAPLNAEFNADTIIGYIPHEVQFTDISTGDIVGWMWDFDSNGTIDSNEQNPIYSYDNAGLYTVSLTVTDGSDEDTEIKEDYITVLIPLDADFETDTTNGDAPLEVHFSDSSEGDINEWMWDFDNNGTIDSNEQNPIHIYENTGVYSVSLTVADSLSEDIEIKEDYIEVTGTETPNNLLPVQTKLFQNHPNPFNPITTIKYSLDDNSITKIEIYNTKGQKISTLFYQNQIAGYHSIVWDGSDDLGNPVSSGLYLYKLIVNNQVISIKKCLLVK